MEGLRSLAPGVAIYLLSFAFTGVYWLNHQQVMGRVQRTGHGLQCANLAFLFCLSLLPLSTAYVVEKQLSGFAAAVYASSLLTVALSFLLLRLAVHGHLRRDRGVNEEDRKGLRNHCFSILFYAASIVLARLYPRGALAAIAALTLFWVVPNLSWPLRDNTRNV